MKRISIEEHFSTEAHLDSLRSILEKNYPIPGVVQEAEAIGREASFLVPPEQERIVQSLLDIGPGRLREMDETEVDMQVLSLVSPGVQVLDAPAGAALARKINDRLSQTIKEYPKRFSGFAALASQNPSGAADELERAVKELGLKGASINSHVKGEYLDHKKYRVIFERAEMLNVPIYLHPRSPHPDMARPYLDYPGMAASMCGFAADVALHVLRLIASGLFDEYPRLKMIIGHLGEALPYWLWRLDRHWPRNPLAKRLKKSPSAYFREHFYITTSGMFWQPPIICCYLALGADRILFAVDYPFESCKMAVDFMESVPICVEDKEKIYHLNAEKLLAL